MQAAVNLPLMVEAEFYSEDTSEFRLSVRAPPKENVAVSLVNLLKLFMYPEEDTSDLRSSVEAPPMEENVSLMNKLKHVTNLIE